MKIEVSYGVSNEVDLWEYLKTVCQKAEKYEIGDDVTLKITYFDAKKTKQYEDFFSIFGGGGRND